MSYLLNKTSLKKFGLHLPLPRYSPRYTQRFIPRTTYTYTRSFQHTPITYQPKHTKEQLLAQSRNFIDSLKIRFKWVLIRQNRPFNIDEITAFISWIVMGNLLWFFIGTTTFCSLVFYLFDKFVNDQNVRNKYLVKLLKFDIKNLSIKIDKSFQMSYNDGMIEFKNMIINNCSVQQLKLNLSFQKWREGKGLIKDLQIDGFKGLFQIDEIDQIKNFLPRSYEFENFIINDSLITVNDLTLQIFHCQLDKLRNNYLFYDFFNSDNCNGAINNSLFTIHTKQLNRNYASFDKINLTKLVNLPNLNFLSEVIDSILGNPIGLDTKHELETQITQETLNKIIRFRIDELDLSQFPHFPYFQWIDTGKMELIADITFPEEPKTSYETKINEEFKSLISGLFHTVFYNDNNELMTPLETTNVRKYIMIDFKFSFKELKLKHTSIINQDLIKFINNYDPDQNTDISSLESELYDEDHLLQEFPNIQFRIIENINNLKLTRLLEILESELIRQLNNLKTENDLRVKRYKDSSYLLRNLILIGLGVCLI